MNRFTLRLLRPESRSVESGQFDVQPEHEQARKIVVLMNRRTATIIVCIVDAAIWAFVVFASLTSQSDAATKGLDQGAGWQSPCASLPGAERGRSRISSSPIRRGVT